jgi:hypothetical protein
MKKFAPDPFVATAIFGSAEFDQPESLDDVVGDEVDDELKEPFDLFFDRAVLERLQLTKTNEPAGTTLAKAASTYRGSIARTEERLIDGVVWVCGFDCDGNLIDAQQVSRELGKRSSDDWDAPLTPGLRKRSTAGLEKCYAALDRVFLPVTTELGKELRNEARAIIKELWDNPLAALGA